MPAPTPAPAPKPIHVPRPVCSNCPTCVHCQAKAALPKPAPDRDFWLQMAWG